jgi:hypothetical protein
VAARFNYITLASDIWILCLTSLMFYFIKKVKPVWIAGNFLMVAFCLASGVLTLLEVKHVIKYILLFQRQTFIVSIEAVLFNYTHRILPPVGLGVNYALFFVIAFIASQTLVPMLTLSDSFPFFFYAGIGVAVIPLFFKFMLEAPARNSYPRCTVTARPST